MKNTIRIHGMSQKIKSKPLENVTVLLSALEPKIKATARSIKAAGVDAEDIAQEFRLKIILEFNRFKCKTIAWWISRLRLYKKRFVSRAYYYKKRRPLDRACSIDSLHRGEEYGV